MSEKDPILIVGGGPTGVVLAIELSRRQVPFKIIDSKDRPVPTSRAFTIHAKTLEIFEQLGIVEKYLNTGIKNYGFAFTFEGLSEKPALDFRILRCRYPYILNYSQNETERLLREHLTATYGVDIEWGNRLTGLETDENGTVTATITNQQTQEEEVFKPSYIVGADGVHSYVRKSLNLPFEGEAYEGMIMQMMDTEVEGYEEDPQWTQYFMKENNFLLTTMLPNGKCRLLVSDQGESADRKKNTRRDAFQQVMDEHGVSGTISEPEWTTQWVIWKRLADIYSKGKVFLCGDSAHVHSPSGGQGMNSCIQDAWNLGWKLAMAWRGEAKAELLDTYGDERKPVAQQVIDGTDHMHDIIMAHGKGMEERMALTQSDGWQIEVTERIAGISYTYFGINKLPDGLETLEGGPRIGDRAPDVDYPDFRTLFGYLRSPEFSMILMPASDAEAAKAVDLLNEASGAFGTTVKSFIVSKQPLDAVTCENTILDPEDQTTEKYGRGNEGRIYLIRPDGYVAFKCSFSQFDKLVEFFGYWFNE